MKVFQTESDSTEPNQNEMESPSNEGISQNGVNEEALSSNHPEQGTEDGNTTNQNLDYAIPAENTAEEVVIENLNEGSHQVEPNENEPFDATFEDLVLQLEALIFASDEALHPKVIRQALENEEITDEKIQKAVSKLNRKYEEIGLTFRIHRIAQGYRFLTIKEFYSTIQKLMQPKLQRRLSQAALETLSIIAYKQPISKSEIESIKGTSVDHLLRMLLEKNLIEVTGRAETIGKPLIYGTSKAFLDYFHLSSLSDLPKPREVEELMRDDEQQAMLKQELNARLKVELEQDATTEEAGAGPV
ncbi:MAG: SMC-Scp complex subunit ScpB [Chloroherpetonaceae bacterium]|nr:SMC-Scp complex subunit ScpB [Chloroherpetonaceae bacterium]